VTSPAAFADRYDFALDAFQADAIDALHAGRSVLVAAPTGAGKTVVAEFAIERSKPALEGAKHARGDARGMPIHPHHSAEGLEPEGMGQTAQELVAAVVMDDTLGDRRAERRHASGQPRRHAAAVQRQIRNA